MPEMPLCAGNDVDPDWWFPTQGRSNSKAITICKQCPLQVTCLETALDMGAYTEGIWGGTTYTERDRMHKVKPGRRSTVWKKPLLALCGTASAKRRHQRNVENCVDCNVRYADVERKARIKAETAA